METQLSSTELSTALATVIDNRKREVDRLTKRYGLTHPATTEVQRELAKYEAERNRILSEPTPLEEAAKRK